MRARAHSRLRTGALKPDIWRIWMVARPMDPRTGGGDSAVARAPHAHKYDICRIAHVVIAYF